MNIAIVSLLLPSGSKIGVGYQVHYLANALVKRGHRVRVFAQTGPSPDSLYDVTIVPSGKRFRTFGFAWNLRDVDFSDYDVINCHGDDWFLWGKDRPWHVHTFHGSCLAETIHARSFKTRLKMGALAVCEYGATQLADELVTVSRVTRKFLPMVKRVIPCGVDTRAFFPGDSKYDRPTLLFVGTLHGRKRGAMLLRLFREYVRPRVPGAQMIVVSEERVEEEGVIWTGRIPTPELTDHFRRAWAFCLPSTYEGFGVPYIEAMASGTAVIASPNDGAREVTDDGRFGVVADDEQLGESIVSLLNDASLRQQYERAGLQRSEIYSWDNVCAAYERIYRPHDRARRSTLTSAGASV